MSRLFSIVLVLFASHAFAGLGEDFNKLKNSGSDYEIVGTVCEEVAKLRYQEEFPASKFEVTTGVEYGDGSRTIGELDVVVFEKFSMKVVRVSEVKCWRDLGGAISKAKNQRSRFINHLNSNKPIFFHSLHSNYEFKKNHFVGVRDFTAVAQMGSKSAGFDYELPYDLKTLMQLRKMMIDCQDKGACARPQH